MATVILQAAMINFHNQSKILWETGTEQFSVLTRLALPTHISRGPSVPLQFVTSKEISFLPPGPKDRHVSPSMKYQSCPAKCVPLSQWGI